MTVGFGAVAFGVRIVKPEGADRADATEVHIPGGDVNYVDIGGRLPSHISLSLKIATDADYASLRLLVGTQATLTIASGAHANTLLVSLTRTARYGAAGLTFADADFIAP